MSLALAQRVTKLERVMYADRTIALDVERDGYAFKQLRNVFYSQKTGRMEPVTYTPPATGLEFHKDRSFFKLIMGPFGSGKSTTCMHEVDIRVEDMPLCLDGVRRARWLIIRNTYDMLETSTIKTWDFWFGNFGRVSATKKPPRYFSSFYDKSGKCELEVIFLALDDEADVRKLKSIDCTAAYVNELNHIPYAIIEVLKGRVGRYPAKTICPDKYYKGIIADTNPPSQRSWIYDKFVKTPTKNWRLFIQPPGLIKNDLGEWVENPERENAANLDDDYYTIMADGETEEYIKVYCLGQFGAVLDGKRVYPEYNDDYHSMHKVEPVKSLPLYLGWDFGLTPACIIGQQLANGRVIITDELVSEDMDLRAFVENIVKPKLRDRYADYTIHTSFIDPAGVAKAQTDGQSCYQMLDEYDLRPEIAYSNDPQVRQRAVKFYLNKMIEGRPALVLSRENASILREGFQGGYHYAKIKSRDGIRFTDKADKNDFSHPHDALQYLMLGLTDNPAKYQDKQTEPAYAADVRW